MIKLPKLKLHKGAYSHTTNNGIEVYAPAYYRVEDVNKFKKAAKKLLAKYKALKSESDRGELDA